MKTEKMIRHIPATGKSPAGQAYPWLVAAALWFVGIAAIGTLMRLSLAAGYALPLPFMHLLHAHSHVAFFGWMGSALTGMYYVFLPTLTGRQFTRPSHITVHFWLLQVCTAGAFFAFLAQGYGAVAIVFCTLHLFLWYYFALRLRAQFRAQKMYATPALALMRLSVVFLVLSSLGTWALPFVMAGGGNGLLKQLSIDFFVHTFADGWLLPGALALALAAGGVTTLHNGAARRQLRLNLLLYIPAVLLSSLRSGAENFPDWLRWTVLGSGVVLGLLHLHLFRLFRKEFRRPLLRLLGLFLLARGMMEFLPVLPGGPGLAVSRPLLIAYLHSKLLGVAGIGVVAAMERLFPARRPVAVSIVPLFAHGAVCMVVSLLLTGTPVLAAWIGWSSEAAVTIARFGQYGALAASLLLLVTGTLLLADRLQKGTVRNSLSAPDEAECYAAGQIRNGYPGHLHD